MIWLFVIGVIICYLILGFAHKKLGGTYTSNYNPNNPNDIYFNPVAQELRKQNEHDKRNW